MQLVAHQGSGFHFVGNGPHMPPIKGETPHGKENSVGEKHSHMGKVFESPSAFRNFGVTNLDVVPESTLTLDLLTKAQPEDHGAREQRTARKRMTPFQRKSLEAAFVENQFPSDAIRTELARELDLCPRNVRFWFQNQRAKMKRTGKKMSAIAAATASSAPMASTTTNTNANANTNNANTNPIGGFQVVASNAPAMNKINKVAPQIIGTLDGGGTIITQRTRLHPVSIAPNVHKPLAGGLATATPVDPDMQEQLSTSTPAANAHPTAAAPAAFTMPQQYLAEEKLSNSPTLHTLPLAKSAGDGMPVRPVAVKAAPRGVTDQDGQTVFAVSSGLGGSANTSPHHSSTESGDDSHNEAQSKNHEQDRLRGSTTASSTAPSSSDQKRITRRRMTATQRELLERVFAVDQFPNDDIKLTLATQLNLSPRNIRFWFQNQRAKVKRAEKMGKPTIFNPSQPSGYTGGRRSGASPSQTEEVVAELSAVQTLSNGLSNPSTSSSRDTHNNEAKLARSVNKNTPPSTLMTTWELPVLASTTPTYTQTQATNLSSPRRIAAHGVVPPSPGSKLTSLETARMLLSLSSTPSC